MESSEAPNETTLRFQAPNPPLFSPFVAKTVKVQGKLGFRFGSACYNENHDMIIACPGNKTVQFYDAATFEPYKGKRILPLRGSVVQMSFHSETDTYLLGCTGGIIYKYNLAKNELKILNRCERPVQSIVVLNVNFYAFLLMESRALCIGSLDGVDNVLRFDLKYRASCSLHYLSKRNLLFSCLGDGDVRIFWTNKLPFLQVLCTAHTGKWITAFQAIFVNRKEYIVTACIDRTVRIWHLIKGRMRLVKVVHSEHIPYSLVYLEDYKMIAIAYNSNYMKFLRLPSLKLERTIYLSGDGIHNLFLVKEKIGVLSKRENLIEFVQLYRFQGK